MRATGSERVVACASSLLIDKCARAIACAFIDSR